MDDRIFVLQKQELTELIDLDGDDVADEYRCVANGWGVTANFHEFAFGLVHVDRYFYATLATAIDPGGASTQPQNRDRGWVVRIARDGSYELVAQGLRTPNGVGLGPKGEVILTDNQGDWLPVSKVMVFQEGAFYGSHSVDAQRTKTMTVTPPVVWLPQGEIGNSPSQPGFLVEGPYAGQWMHGDVTHGGIKRVFPEEVDGVMQGAVFRFTQGLEGGVNRISRGPDGAIYAGGIGSTGNWGQTGKKRYGLQRLAYNGRSTFEMLAVRARKNGFEIEFTAPLDEAAGLHADDYAVSRWRYVPTAAYGGPKVDVVRIHPSSISRSEDRRRVLVELRGTAMVPDHVYHIQLARSVRGVEATAPWATEAWYTLNRVPEEEGTVLEQKRQPHNTLSDEEVAAGWRLLFDGQSTKGWRGYQKKLLPDGWVAEDGTLTRRDGGTGGDIVSGEEFDDFELSLEWKIAEKGNSGIFFRATETEPAIWHHAPEMQVLDNDAFGMDGTHPQAAGANYGLHPPALDVARPAGAWNLVRIVVKGSHVEQWLNGYKLVEYELWDEDWKKRAAASKFSKYPGYGMAKHGHIALQDHGSRVWFRNLKLRPLK